MSALYSLRREIRNVLVASGLWTREQILIKRRSDIWNDVAVATDSAEGGQCLVIGIAKGVPARDQQAGSKAIIMEITIPITMIELPNVDPDEPADDAATDEETRWEATVLALQANPLGRSAVHYTLNFDGFEDVEDDEYVIRQTVFKTRLILKPA